MEKLNELEDPRSPSNGTRHDFREILVIAVCAMLSDADSFEDIALFRCRGGPLARTRPRVPAPHSVPSHPPGRRQAGQRRLDASERAVGDSSCPQREKTRRPAAARTVVGARSKTACRKISTLRD